jgi:hypothetical protein
MVRGPAAWRKPFVVETKSLWFASEFRSFESDERNLFRVAGTLNAVVGTRHELEERVLNCLPVAFYSLDIFEKISQKMVAHEVSKLKTIPSRKDQVISELASIKSKQASLMQQICQSARNIDPLSASNIYPPVGQVRVTGIFGFSFESGF